VKLKKPREVLELAVLSCACVLLLYYSCRGHGDAVQSATPRESKTFAAVRSAADSVDDTADAVARERAVEVAIGELIGAVALGQVEESGRAEAQRSLVTLLETWRWGTDQNRATGAAVVVQQIFDRAKIENRSAELSMRQVQAIQGVAKELARELLLLAVGSSAGADGISAALPAGHERITWNQLGSFPYNEGGALPAEVMALDGHAVGIFGFMLTLNSSEHLSEFVLVESLWGCCFGTVPEVNQTIIVRVDPKTTAQYSAAPLLVTGRLEVGEEREGGFVTSVYRIVDAHVSAAEP
jgi:uncharacterized protein DUF3299